MVVDAYLINACSLSALNFVEALFSQGSLLVYKQKRPSPPRVTSKLGPSKNSAGAPLAKEICRKQTYCFHNTQSGYILDALDICAGTLLKI
jgi:hypothetical protein